MKYFKGSFVFTLICLFLAALLGYHMTGTSTGILSTVFICLVLGILEISLSFDNAVVNATVLTNMSDVWQRRFLTWGVLIAVFGMRLLFPLIIVGFAAHLGPVSALMLAIEHPDQYTHILSGAHTAIMGFGGSFLAMVGLKYFLDAEKEVHWITIIEQQLTKLGKLEAVEIGIILLTLLAMSQFLPATEAFNFIIAGLSGLVAFIAVEAIGTILEAPEETTTAVAKTGLGAFLYLEVMDASFSFDGVIGAFALSTNLFVIALGLGIGAMFVRSLTIMLVKKGTLAEYRYLEHGAFWAILSLATLMFVSVYHDIPEVITGLIGAALIGIAAYSSIRWNKLNPEIN
ncbi:hypothetical protein FBY50_1661 [Zymomonas mobilis]|uniref:DUF475 domain-containing protein n=1 Tax=Zymomonas mobilis TaxID=542 RepID=UPI000B38B91F|nr:DUF475 domain-containing protein [Zymomonas mobilis]ART94066.1 hypothetical protein B9T50_08065 [Zymomonas mobilis subsp. mobilis]TWD60812.1 hypothetical protein FBY50_1661 [Zymomonas mobilis]